MKELIAIVKPCQMCILEIKIKRWWDSFNEWHWMWMACHVLLHCVHQTKLLYNPEDRLWNEPHLASYMDQLIPGIKSSIAPNGRCTMNQITQTCSHFLNSQKHLFKTAVRDTIVWLFPFQGFTVSEEKTRASVSSRITHFFPCFFSKEVCFCLFWHPWTDCFCCVCVWAVRPT